MSKPMYVSDDIAVICVQGLRMVVKWDRKKDNYSSESYGLEFEYKGLTRRVGYGKDKSMRDKTYSEIVKLLTPKEE